jgi:methylenetetrahydrofolate reductase (NADPH)
VIEEPREGLTNALARARFEIIPIRGAEEQASHLPRGTTVTVTCSPARGIEATISLAERLTRQGLQAVPHISARLVVDRAHLQDVVQRLADLGLRHIFVVGGDVKHPAGPFASALDLLRAMAELGHPFEEIGVAAYPEGHPFIDETALRQALSSKQDFATYMVTQICFDPQAIVRWLSGVRRGGIELPVYIGAPGVVDRAQLLRVSIKVGVGTSLRFISKQRGLATTLLKPGSYHPTTLLERLAPYVGDAGYRIQGLHLNTFNQVEETEAWRQQMLVAAVNGADAVSGPGVAFAQRQKETP